LIISTSLRNEMAPTCTGAPTSFVSVLLIFCAGLILSPTLVPHCWQGNHFESPGIRPRSSEYVARDAALLARVAALEAHRDTESPAPQSTSTSDTKVSATSLQAAAVAHEPLFGLSTVTGFLETARCPSGDDLNWLEALHPSKHFALVTYGKTDFISSVCLDAAAAGSGSGSLMFFEEPVSDFIVALLRGALASGGVGAGGSNVGAFDKPWLLDVGSNIGVHSLAAAAANFAVLAIEATPGTAARLRCSAARNNFFHLAVINAAVSDANAPSHLCVSEWVGNMGGNHLGPGTCPDGNKRVPTLQLDKLFAALPTELRAPTVLKMDVEGFEFQALRGGKTWLAGHRPAFVVTEVAPDYLARNGDTWTDLIFFWLDLGYQVWLPAPVGAGATTIEISRESMRDSEMLRVAIGRCDYNIVLSLDPTIFRSIPIPADFCQYKGPWTHTK